MNIKPIGTNDIAFVKTPIPDCVIQSFNELIVKNMAGNTAIIQLEEIISLIISKDKNISRQQIYDNHWLNIENIYRQVGWIVNYYNEEYTSKHFTFIKR